jgi:hypothetical protein
MPNNWFTADFHLGHTNKDHRLPPAGAGEAVEGDRLNEGQA